MAKILSLTAAEETDLITLLATMSEYGNLRRIHEKLLKPVKAKKLIGNINASATSDDLVLVRTAADIGCDPNGSSPTAFSSVDPHPADAGTDWPTSY